MLLERARLRLGRGLLLTGKRGKPSLRQRPTVLSAFAAIGDG
jgi:hypothetical protein